MARINMDDDVESKSNFWRLLPLVGGDRDCALGKLVRFFRIAQKYYGKELPIPIEELETEGLTCMIESGWAVQVEGGYQAKGADDHFDWYRQKVEAGKMGGRPKKPKSDSANRPVISGNRPVSPANPLALAPVLAPSPVIKNKELKANEKPVRHDIGMFIGSYVKAYQKRYPGARPDLSPKVQGEIKRYLDGAPSLERACELIQVYCQLEGQTGWFKKKHHDFTTFVQNQNEVSYALDTGNIPGAEKPVDYEALLGGEESA